jgi:hypothetical protein
VHEHARTARREKEGVGASEPAARTRDDDGAPVEADQRPNGLNGRALVDTRTLFVSR